MLTSGSLVSLSDTLLTDQPTPLAVPRTHSAKLWLPQRVVFTPDALDEEFGQQILARAVEGLRVGQSVTLALRPEKITINREPVEGANAIAKEVKDLAYFGKDSLYRIALPSGALISVHAVNANRGAEEARLADWYDKVWLSFATASAILLTE